jgi:homoisocitrate dehydrogenase
MFRSKTILKGGNFYSKKIALMPADGIGKEVVPSAEKILRNFTNFEFVTLDVGFECFQRTKNALPEETIQGLKTCDGAIFGVYFLPSNEFQAVSSPSHKVEGYSSPIVKMRKIFDLYANLRPISKLLPTKSFSQHSNQEKHERN